MKEIILLNKEDVTQNIRHILKFFLLNEIDIVPYPHDNYILLFEPSQRFTCFLVGMTNNEVWLPLGIALTLH